MSKTGKIIFLILGLLLLSTDVALASGTTTVSTSLADSGTEAKGLVSAVIKAFIWALAFVPVWSAWYFASKMKEHLENKEEQGQYEPKAAKNFKIVMAVIIGIVAAYLVIGIFAKVFLNMEFNEAWITIVAGVWNDLTGLGSAGRP